MENSKLVGHVINVSVLSELLISEMDQLKGTIFWKREVKSAGNLFDKAINRQTSKMYSDMGDEASAQFNGQIDVFNTLFDAICSMGVDQRIDLIEHINTHNRLNKDYELKK